MVNNNGNGAAVTPTRDVNHNATTAMGDRRFSALSRRSTIGGDPGRGHAPQELVRPMIYRYTCRGKLSLSNQKEELLRTTGACRGVASQLELVDIWKTVPREQAIQVFSQQIAAQNPSTNDGEDVPAEQALQTAMETQVLVYPEGMAGSWQVDGEDGAADSGSGADGKDKHGDGNGSQQRNDTAETDEIESDAESPHSLNHNLKNKSNKATNAMMASNSPTNTSVLFPAQDWDCYGSTRVDLLVLRSADGKSPDVNMNLNPSANARGQNSREDPSLSRRGLNNEESIAAVAPYTSTGVSVRDISHKGWASSRLRDRIITLQLGVLEVIYQQVVEDISENEYEENNSTNKSDGPKSADDRTSSSTKESQSSNDKQMTFPSRFRNSAGKILHHMQFNAKLLRDSVREDFSGRTYAAGKRIVDKFGSTAENMNKFALKIIYQTTGFFGDDDEDGGGGSSRRGGGW